MVNNSKTILQPRRLNRFLISIAVLLTSWAVPVRGAEQWLPITKEDLALREIPACPDAAAVILYRSVDRHDDLGYEDDYIRIKILKQEGLRYADIETPPFVREYGLVGDIKARTIKADGTIIPFTGRVLEKLILKNSLRKEVSLAFTLPGVDVGSIIEYRYKQRFAVQWAEQYGTEWRVQDDLFVKRATFSLRPSAHFRLKWVASHLLDGAEPKQSGGKIALTVEDVPPFEAEEYMPPESEVRARVYFYYANSFEPEDTEHFWKTNGEAWKRKAERFMDQRQALRTKVSGVLTPKDVSTQAKMRRLYELAQTVRNLSWESNRQEQEEESSKLRENTNVDDVLKRGYGTKEDVNRLYAALLKEAGIYAAIVRVPEREQSFFHPQIPRWEQLDSEIIVARDNEREYFLDPGTPYCPFGELPWQRTAVMGWRSDTMTWDEVPGITSDTTNEIRKAELVLNKDGSLTGILQISYLGQTALSRRLLAKDEDEAERKREIEDEVEAWLPPGSKAQVVAMNGWTSGEVPLTIDIKLTILGLAEGSSQRMLIPNAVLHGQDRYPFQSANRLHSVYFEFPFSQADDITIRLGSELRLAQAPEPLDIVTSFAKFSSSIAQSGNTFRQIRELRIQNLMLSPDDYPKLQSFFAKVKAADSDDFVFATGPASGHE